MKPYYTRTLLTLSLFLSLSATLQAQQELIVNKDILVMGRAEPIRVSMIGITGEAAQVIHFALIRSGRAKPSFGDLKLVQGWLGPDRWQHAHYQSKGSFHVAQTCVISLSLALPPSLSPLPLSVCLVKLSHKRVVQACSFRLEFALLRTRFCAKCTMRLVPFRAERPQRVVLRHT